MSRGETFDAGTLRVKGVAYKIRVDDAGKWIACPGHEVVEADSRDALGKAIEQHTRKATAKIAVPFVQLLSDGARARRGTATGLHSGRGNILVRWSNGETGQLATYERVVHELTEEQITWWIAKRQEATAALNELHAFEKAHEIKLASAVKEALNAAVSGDAAGE